MRQPRGYLTTFALSALVMLMAGTALVPAPSSAGSLSSAVIGTFPKQVTEFAYVDLKSARQCAWFRELRDQLLPPHFREYEQFLSLAGVDPNSQVDELAWGKLPMSRRGGEEMVGIGLGSFDPSSDEERFKQQRLPVANYQGYHLYASGAARGADDILFTFLDSNTTAFGHRPALEKLVDLRMSSTESLLTNDMLFPLIDEANGSGVIWAVCDKTYAQRVIRQLVPEAGLLPQASAIINRMHAMMISVGGGNSLDAHLQVVCGSVDDANLLAAALQAGVIYRRYQAEQTSPDVAQEALENIRVIPSGDRLKVEGSLSDDQLGALIKSGPFAVPM